MSEKRFTFDYEYEFEIYDKQTKKHYDGTVGCQEKLVDLLNEQQSTINELQSIINHIKCEENCFDYDYCCETVCSLYKEIKHLKEENEQLRQQSEHYRKNRDKWKQKALAKDEQLKDCDNDCFNCRFYNKVCDFCTKFHIYTMTSGDGV